MSFLTLSKKEKFTGTGVEDQTTENRNGRKYIGEYKDGKEHGIGIYSARGDQHIFAGQFKDNKAEGIGFKSYPINDEFYCGEYKDNKRHGIGYWKVKTGASFLGEHKDGDIDGFGTLITHKGLKFIGIVKHWIPIKGKWYNSKNEETDIIKEGYDISGFKYTGDLDNIGKYHGYGTCISPDGSKYVGEWQNNQHNGNGTMTHPSGETYQGEWKDGQQHGFGTLNHYDTVYVGNFKNNLKHGLGTMTNTHTGRKYVGHWENNHKTGHGTLTKPDGTVLGGEWNDDKLAGDNVH